MPPVRLASRWIAGVLAVLAVSGCSRSGNPLRVATGYISHAAQRDRSAASGIYLASYFIGGLVGTAVLGQVFDRLGWPATVVGIGVALGVAAILSFRLRDNHT